jgi:hypothetical protein
VRLPQLELVEQPGERYLALDVRSTRTPPMRTSISRLVHPDGQVAGCLRSRVTASATPAADARLRRGPGAESSATRALAKRECITRFEQVVDSAQGSRLVSWLETPRSLRPFARPLAPKWRKMRATRETSAEWKR